MLNIKGNYVKNQLGLSYADNYYYYMESVAQIFA